MNHAKLNGVYYTPEKLTDFCVSHYSKYYLYNSKKINILEPSCGDGGFTNSINRKLKNIKLDVDLVDIDKKELLKAKERFKRDKLTSLKVTTHNCDFIDYESNKKYDLIIGNPPYIGKRYMSPCQIDNCKLIQSIGGYTGEVKNIWTAFMYKFMTMLDKRGTLCQVLPIELLQVNYTKHLRDLLLTFFKRIEIFTFKEILFEGTLQDVILLFASNSKKIVNHGVSFYEVAKIEDLSIPNWTEQFFNLSRSKQDKWTNYILTDQEIIFIEECKKKCNYSPIINFCEKIEVGIVTAANNFFILNYDALVDNGLIEYGVPVIQKSSNVRGFSILDDSLIKHLDENGVPAWLVQFPDKKIDNLDLNAVKYIRSGQDIGLHKRFKMLKRNNWYHVPQKWIADLFFMKRIHKYPRVMVNKSNYISTDVLYQLKVLPIYEPSNILYSFYNVLTFIDCELKGRYYGGGVLELTPNEFKSIDIPYGNYGYKTKNKIRRKIMKNEIDKAIEVSSKSVLSNLDEEEIVRLNKIYSKLKSRRLRK